jgi:hypothetical protein
VRASFPLPAGSGVLVRFSYYTDEAVSGKGWFLDDVSVDTTGGLLPAGAVMTDGFETDAQGWVLDGWQLTTGLFANNWAASYVSPVYSQGKLLSLAVGAFDENSISGLSEWETGLVDNSRLEGDAVTMIISNRPGESPFAAAYELTVGKSPSSTTFLPMVMVALTTAPDLAAATPIPSPALAVSAAVSATATMAVNVSPTVSVTAAPTAAPEDSGTVSAIASEAVTISPTVTVTATPTAVPDRSG